MKKRKLNSAQKNYKKQHIKVLHDKRTTEIGKIVGWTVIGILLLPTIIVPYIAHGYIKGAIQKRKEILEEINSM